MRVVLIFCMVLCAIVPTVGAISAVITPKNSLVVKKGDDIRLQCTLNNITSTETAEYIRWYKDNIDLSPSLSTVDGNATSNLTIPNATFTDSGNYACGFQEENFDQRVTLVVTVALPPDSVRNLTCHTANMFDIYCEWWKGARETNIMDKYVAEFRRSGPLQAYPFKKINDVTNDSCYFYDETLQELIIRITTTNSLGSAYSEVKFHPAEEAIPNPPENVLVVPGYHSLSVTWNEPAEKNRYYTITYLCQYEGCTINKTTGVKTQHKNIVLQNLDGHVDYTIYITARYDAADFSKPNDYWSEPGVMIEKTLDGAPFGMVSDVVINSERDRRQGYRDIELTWQDVPKCQWGSVDIDYEVTLRPPNEGWRDLPYESIIKTVSIPAVMLYDVSKYQTYSVEIIATNHNGSGPLAAYTYLIPDRTTYPDKPSDLNVSVEDGTTLAIKWNPPKDPNGVVYRYEVMVNGTAHFSSNSSNVTQRGSIYKSYTTSLVTFVKVNCSDLTDVGIPVDIAVAAETKNFTQHLFAGEYAHMTIDRICFLDDIGPNLLLWGIFIPMVVIVSCIIALVLWNCFRDSCVEPPDPKLPTCITKNGRFVSTMGHPCSPVLEKECFDELKPRDISRNDTAPIVTRLHTNLNTYHNSPSGNEKNTLHRYHSHDSGVPDSPVDSGNMEFANLGYEDENAPDAESFVPSVSRSNSENESDIKSGSWRDSVFSHDSEDSGAMVSSQQHESDTGPVSPISQNDGPSGDPYFKLTALPPSPTKNDSSPYIASPSVGHTTHTLNHTSEDGKSVGGYVKQYQLHLSLTDISASPYMSPLSDAPISTSVPNGYVPTECMTKMTPRPLSTPDGYKPMVPELYSHMSNAQCAPDGYVHHDAMQTISKPTSPSSADYVKEDFLFSTGDDYQDNYPDFSRKQWPGPTEDAYIQHEAVVGPPEKNEKPAPSSNSSGYSTDCQMPYSKLAINK